MLKSLLSPSTLFTSIIFGFWVPELSAKWQWTRRQPWRQSAPTIHTRIFPTKASLATITESRIPSPIFIQKSLSKNFQAVRSWTILPRYTCQPEIRTRPFRQQLRPPQHQVTIPWPELGIGQPSSSLTLSVESFDKPLWCRLMLTFNSIDCDNEWRLGLSGQISSLYLAYPSLNPTRWEFFIIASCPVQNLV